ncbi:MAG: hypothetical protein A2087_13045 [Spirochaetes bacterium GWD1_61_31]|nr:MAG: hypothetical protein A2Y37_02450 [Spirochaetes bacterium GWB1_60_80]OHD39424.1 MAG: hypothetical protein A2087_13045 [Spirochaetes bacterium GWD1_61_31]OHD45479.1 MAG: hypothetical protein A2Y35_02720 [Spirochaetes bacterium GWE1_60_18]HAP44616.1 hypothetical protein [Spirochaetaceae bacterium]HAW86481.1 hypothetical protein [Spirochaetaceae bacterium]
MAIFLMVLPVWGMSERVRSSDAALTQAEDLIEAQQYDDAILLLTQFIKDYPERFGDAQRLLQDIIQRRMAFNVQAAALLDAIDNNATDQELHIALIRQLESFERNPDNPALLAFINETRYKAVFTYNNAEFSAIMQNGQRLIDELRYAEAAALYATGYDLYWEELERGDYDPGLVAAARDSVSGVRAAVTGFGPRAEAMASAFAAVTSAYQDYGSGQPAPDLATAQAMAREYAALRGRVSDYGWLFAEQYRWFRTTYQTENDDFFQAFAFRLTLGEPAAGQLQGVVGAMDAHWAAILGATKAALDERLATLFEAGLGAYGQAQWATVADSMVAAATLAASGLDLVSLWSLLLPNELVARTTDWGRVILESKGRDYANLAHLVGLAVAWADLARLVQSQAAVDLAFQQAAAIDDLSLEQRLADYVSYRGQISEVRQAILELRAVSAARAEWLAGVVTAGYGEELSTQRQGRYDGQLASAIGLAESAMVRIAAAEAEKTWQRYNERFLAIQGQLALAETNLAGLPASEDASSTVIYRYPALTLEGVGQADSLLRQLNAEIVAFIARYRADADFIATAPALSIWLGRGSELSAQATTALAEGARLAGLAREQRRLAESAKLEAERRLQESRTALRAGNFELARERLERSSERYTVSLSHEQDAALRETSARLLQELQATIRDAENRVVVAETRRLLDAGSALYRQGEFVQAERSLLQAKARYAITNIEPNGEVEYWLALVQNALAVESGRDIPQTAPLYPEMSQLLSNARQLYEEGSRLMAARDTVAANRAFVRAKDYIARVQLIFPLNEDAGTLLLHIQRLADPTVFSRQVAAMLTEARTNIRAGVDLREIRNRLKNIEAVEPNFPGLQSLIVEVEIALGLRDRPPDPAALALARERYQAALRVWNARNATQFAVAIVWLDQALTLNPGFAEAKQLKDSINYVIGGQMLLVLSAEAESLYADAVRLFTGGEYLAARGRLNRIYTIFASARQVQKVIDLDTRLTALGY